jgi:predicted RNA-binding protein with PUA-like domain
VASVAYWLLKTEPSAYSFDDLVRDRGTAWTGVANPQAQANLRTMRSGDRAVIYHSGEKRAVDLAVVTRAAYHDPSAEGRDLVCVDVRAEGPLPAPVSLEALKLAPAFEGSPLLRQGRLSVVPLTPAAWKSLARLAAASPGAAGEAASPRKKARGRPR